MMETTFCFYADANLSSVVADLSELFPDAPESARTRVIWLGSRNPARRLRAVHAGGAITVSLTGEAASHIRLGKTAQAAAAANAGAPLELKATIREPVPLWLRIHNADLAAGSYPATLTLTAIEEQLR